MITFEELGVDKLFVDEAHGFKNLFLATKMRNVAGIGQSEAQKSSDMFAKCRYLDEITGGRGVVFATGTPVSNSMVELYTMMRYLQYDLLQSSGLEHFDSWAANFGETTTSLELAPEGTGFRSKTRFAKFFNLPELMAMWREAADIQTADMLRLPVPEAEKITEVTTPSDFQRDLVADLGERAEAVRNREVEPREDNMLKITSDGRKLALDQRLSDPTLPDDPESKVNVCVRNVLQVWRDTEEIKGTQLVFCDLSTPKGDSLGLLPYRTHHPNTLSGGQKQRVAVAVSMICGKELLVFDEPTSGLDFDSMEQVALLIQKLSAMGKVIFVVTNDYEFVCRTCSRVLHIDHGEQCDDFPLVPDNEENLKKLFSI